MKDTISIQPSVSIKITKFKAGQHEPFEIEEHSIAATEELKEVLNKCLSQTQD